MDTLRKLLAIIIEQEVKLQQAVKANADLKAQLDKYEDLLLKGKLDAGAI